MTRASARARPRPRVRLGLVTMELRCSSECNTTLQVMDVNSSLSGLDSLLQEALEISLNASLTSRSALANVGTVDDLIQQIQVLTEHSHMQTGIHLTVLLTAGPHL